MRQIWVKVSRKADTGSAYTSGAVGPHSAVNYIITSVAQRVNGYARQLRDPFGHIWVKFAKSDTRRDGIPLRRPDHIARRGLQPQRRRRCLSSLLNCQMFNFFRPRGGSALSSWKEDDQRRQNKPESKPKRSPQKSPSDIHALPAPNALPAPSRQPPTQGEALKRSDPNVDSPAPQSSKPTHVRAQEPRVADRRSDQIKTPSDSPAPRSSKPTGEGAQRENAPRRVITTANFGGEQPSKRPACRSPTALMEAIQSLIVEADMEELRASSQMVRSDAGRAALSSRLPLPRLESESAGRNSQAVRSAATLAKAAAPVASAATAEAIARSRRVFSSASMQQDTPEKPTSAAEHPGVEEDILQALFTNELGENPSTFHATLTVAAISTSTLSSSSQSSGSAHAFETGVAYAAPADAPADGPADAPGEASAASLVPAHADSPAAIVPVESMPTPTLAGAAANEGAPAIASVPAPAPASMLECTRPQATNQIRSNTDGVVRADDTHAGASGSYAVSRTRGADPTVFEGMEASGSSMQSTPLRGQPVPNACATPSPRTPAREQTNMSIMAERGAQLPSAIESTSAVEVHDQDSVAGGLPTPDRIRTASAEDSFAILKTEEIISDPLLVESALARLGSLCSARSSARQSSKARSLPLLADGIGSIVRALDAHGESESVQAAGCSLISRLASNEARKQEVADAGAFGAIQAAFSRHTASVRVAKWGGLAVLKLTQDSSVRCQLAIAAGLGDALSSVVAELSHTRGALRKDCNAKALASIYLAQNWLQLHSDLVAGPNHFVVFRDTAGLPSKVARRYDDPRKSPLRLDLSPEAQMLTGTPAGALRPPFEWSVRDSPVFPSRNKGQEVEEPEPKGWDACLKPCLISLREF